MNSSDYSMYFSAKTMMGPNSARILEELFTKYPLHLTEKDEVLDLGCGTGLTSLIIAKESCAPSKGQLTYQERILSAKVWPTSSSESCVAVSNGWCEAQTAGKQEQRTYRFH